MDLVDLAYSMLIRNRMQFKVYSPDYGGGSAPEGHFPHI